MNLHPSGFIETAGGCEGPRLTRSQPSRETGGVLLNECEAKYVPNFQLPYRNISRYVSEIQNSWDRLSTKDKKVVTENLFKNVPELVKTIKVEQVGQAASNTALSFIRDFVALDPEKNTKDILDALYHPSETIKQTIPISKIKEIQRGVEVWSADQNIGFHLNNKTFFMTLLLLLLFFTIGVATCKGTLNK